LLPHVKPAKNEALELSGPNPLRRRGISVQSSTKDSLIISLGHPLGIDYSTETTHTVLLSIQPKVFDQVQFPDAVPIAIGIGRGKVQQKKCTASKSAVLSLPTGPKDSLGAGRFITFFAQAKKVEQYASRQKVE